MGGGCGRAVCRHPHMPLYWKPTAGGHATNATCPVPSLFLFLLFLLHVHAVLHQRPFNPLCAQLLTWLAQVTPWRRLLPLAGGKQTRMCGLLCCRQLQLVLLSKGCRGQRGERGGMPTVVWPRQVQHAASDAASNFRHAWLYRLPKLLPRQVPPEGRSCLSLQRKSWWGAAAAAAAS